MIDTPQVHAFRPKNPGKPPCKYPRCIFDENGLAKIYGNFSRGNFLEPAAEGKKVLERELQQTLHDQYEGPGASIPEKNFELVDLSTHPPLNKIGLWTRLATLRKGLQAPQWLWF